MKRSVLLTLVCCVVSSVSAQVIFDNNTFNKVLERAKKENKQVFVDCYAVWCGPCKMLEKDIFPDKKVGEFLNEKFINFKSDMEKGEGIILRKKYNITFYPTLLILNSDGSEYSRCVGTDDSVDGFIEMVNKMLRSDLAKLRSKFKTSLEGANQFIQILNDNYMIEERDRALVSVYNRRKTADNYSNVNFSLYNSMITNIYHPVALSILNDGNNAIHHLGRKQYSEFVKNKVDFTLTEMAMNNRISSDRIRELATMSKKYKEMRTPILNYYIKTADDIDARNVEAVIAHSSKIFKNLKYNERLDIVRFTHRIAVNNRQMEKLIPFYEQCITRAKNDNEAKGYKESINLVKNLLSR